jgi:Zn-dependent peptidase ImmA (M78 family)
MVYKFVIYCILYKPDTTKENPIMFADRLKRARVSSGFSMQKLASKVGISANMIKKYEHGESMPSSATLIKLAASLGLKSEYFFRPTQIALQNIQYRKKSSLPRKVLQQIEADVLEQAERWFELKQLWPHFPISPAILPPATIQNLDDIETYAMNLRSMWNLGIKEIPNLTSLLEEHGFLVIMTHIQTQGACDGLQASIEGTPILVCQHQGDGTRQRFTLAHELAHFAFASSIPPELDLESCCHRFAQAFLLPLPTLHFFLGTKRQTLEIGELYLIKHRYGISMQACIRRAFDTGIISESTYKNLCIVFSSNGWRKQEPGEPYPLESTSFFKHLVYRALGENIIGEAKAAELLGQSVMEFHRSRYMRDSDAAVVSQ